MSGRFGLLDPQPFQFGVNMPNNQGGYDQVHFHGPDLNTLTSGHVKMPNGQYGQTFNGYESAMLDFAATMGGWKKY